MTLWHLLAIFFKTELNQPGQFIQLCVGYLPLGIIFKERYFYSIHWALRNRKLFLNCHAKRASFICKQKAHVALRVTYRQDVGDSKAEIWKAENGDDTGAQISSESSGLTHNYTQVKTLFVHTRIKLLNRKTKVVGAGLHSTSFISWSSGGSINLPLQHKLYQQYHFFLFLK